MARRAEVLGWRNVFLLGYLHFVALGGYFAATTNEEVNNYVPSEHAAGVLAVAQPLFLLVYLLFDMVGRRTGSLERLVPRLNMTVTAPAIVITSVLLTGSALFLAAIPIGGYLGGVLGQFRGGLAASGLALAVYFFLAQRFNPASIVLLVLSLGAGILATTVGESGRRLALGVLIAVPWMWYFATLRLRGPIAVSTSLLAIGTAGVIALAVYGSVRHQDAGFGGGGRAAIDVGTRAEQISELISNPRFEARMLDNLIYTDTSHNTMFIIDTYPNQYDVHPLNDATYIITNPIPRALWPDKPRGLGDRLRDEMGTVANLGPGIIGHAWASWMWLGIVGYAAAFGIAFGVLDRALRHRIDSPFFIAASGAGMGNMVAMARGDVALFVIQVVTAVLITVVIMVVIAAILEPITRAFPPLRRPGKQPADHSAEDDYEQWSDYGFESEDA
ncbi:MAG: hypothetical protein EA378_02105 [Phycisphaerales bacterium]|nr:MAG: hypothetical protein EA378_02105 [Phycisphaerales bacterium]